MQTNGRTPGQNPSPASLSGGRRRKSQRRPPPNNKEALRWVVESVERLSFSDENDGEGMLRYDANVAPPHPELLVALRKLLAAGTQRELAEVGRKIQSLRVGETESYAVQERVVKATAMAGLVQISLEILRSMLQGSVENEMDAKGIYIPSAMSYVAVLNSLRRLGKVSQMKRVLDDIATACREVNRGVVTRAETNISIASDAGDVALEGSQNGAGVDIIALNVYLAALADILTSKPVKKLSWAGRTKVSQEASVRSSNDVLMEAFDLLRPDAARERFCTVSEPDLTSYNTVLGAAASVGNKTIADAVWNLMDSVSMKGDRYTYNGRLKAALCATSSDGTGETTKARLSVSATSEKSEINGSHAEALSIIDEILSKPELQADRYTVDLALVPLVRSGRIGDVLNLLATVGDTGTELDELTISNAFSTFLITLVKAGDVETARTIFDAYLSPEIVNADGYNSGSLAQENANGSDIISSGIRPKATARHFNVLIEAYRRRAEATGDQESDKNRMEAGGNEKSKSSGELFEESGVTSGDDARSKAMELFDAMVQSGIKPDAYTLTSLMALQTTPDQITALWTRAVNELNVRMTAAVYRSIMTAYGKANDPSSACWVFDVMESTLGRTSLSCWNALLAALARCGANERVLDIFSSHAVANGPSVQACTGQSSGMMSPAEPGHKESESEPSGLMNFSPCISNALNGMTCADASKAILNLMNRVPSGEGTYPVSHATLPDSQSYCLVAAAISHGETSPDVALQLFRNATQSGVPADGRFLNAIFRCFGDQIDAAIAAWKEEIGRAARAHENRKRNSSPRGRRRKGKNLIAAYHGLLYVCGRAGRPDMAVRIVYAMTKQGIEPTETSLNCYNSGKRVWSREVESGVDIKESGGRKRRRIRLADQYESILTVECIKYDMADKRRFKEKRVKIIL